MRLLTLGLLVASLALPPGALAQHPAESEPGPAPGPSVQVYAMPADPKAMAVYEAAQQEAFEKHGPFGVVTMRLNQHEIVVLCQTIAEGYASVAAEDTDHDRRIGKFADVWRFEQRLTEPLARAREALGEDGYASALSTGNQAMVLLSMLGDPQLEQDLQSGAVQADDDLMFGWVTNLAIRCGQRLDDMGIDRVSGDPPPEYIETMTGFRYRGATYAKVFAGTGLVRFAKAMCREESAPDFTGAPLDQRGEEGMSLLDWAIECNDRVAFDALIAAGFDLDATGLYEDPPLVRTASEKRLWFLSRLLDEGVSPDTMGRTKSALVEANDDLDAINFRGDTRAAFNLLRARGATLSFPTFRDSMWYQWSLHETRWDLILRHWDEFESDPVELASDLEFYFSGEMNWAKKEHAAAAGEVKKLLVEQYGVCFPVGKPFEMETDERGFRMQPDCPKGE
ncbi:hypothetical protein LY632_07580 [Erythrobacter sp. SDW2]|uniref:hypothetical protein n=1 Tax=Erythrobacter sp. SDW2 TaxID=2907154 RepID=UPI001F2BAFBD|nr:hypothetical protein [Erythrobacter sp. SDW2]UIP05580.1 hypothetical protein LY632_07580 [Erythrobacter sp. SDW2]